VCQSLSIGRDQEEMNLRMICLSDKLLHDSCQHHRLVLIVHGERVMGQNRHYANNHAKQRNGGDEWKFWFHWLICSLFKNMENFLWDSSIGFIPVFFEILFPVLSPRAAVEIDKARIRVGQLFRSAIGVLNVAETFNIRVSASGIIDSGTAGKAISG